MIFVQNKPRYHHFLTNGHTITMWAYICILTIQTVMTFQRACTKLTHGVRVFLDINATFVKGLKISEAFFFPYMNRFY